MAVFAPSTAVQPRFRVCRVNVAADTLEPEAVYRVAHTPERDGAGHLRWDWPAIIAAVVDGLERSLELGPLASIGVDASWLTISAEQ